jgi:hypothetical protein
VAFVFGIVHSIWLLKVASLPHWLCWSGMLYWLGLSYTPH